MSPATEVHLLAQRLGLHAQPDGACWRLSTHTGAPMYLLSRRGLARGGSSWSWTPLLDLAVVREQAAGDAA